MKGRVAELKLLIVDDEPLVRNGLQNGFDWGRIGIEVIGASRNGLDAIERIKAEKPGIVLSDIKMPGMDGLGLAAWIKETVPETEIIFLTGYSDFDYAKSAIGLQAADYILKPVQEEQLFRVIEKVKKKIELELARRAQYEHAMDIINTAAQDKISNTEARGPREDGKIPSSQNDARGDTVEAIMEYLKNNYMNDIDLNTVASEFALNPSYLSRLFHEKTGVHFTEFINNLRIQKAKELIKTTRYSLDKIGRMAGYQNGRYFSRLFKKREGMTPQEYRLL